MTKWERATQWPLAVIALGFLAAYAWPILQPDLDAGVRAACEVMQWIAWTTFAVDYVVRLCLAEHRWAFVRRNLLDLVILALPLLRPLRLLRLAVLLRVFNRSAKVGLHGRVVTYVVGSAVFWVRSPRSPSSTPNGATQGRPSRRSATRCGGRSAP